MKFNKLAASISLVAAVFIIGCGSGSGSSEEKSSSTSSTNASDAYIIAFENGKKSGIVSALCNGKIKNVLATIKGPKGYIEFNESLNNCIVTFPSSVYVDSNLNGTFDKNDTIISMPLKTKIGKSKWANPISTYLIEKNNLDLLNTVSDFDPVEAYKKAAEGDIKAKNLLKVSEIIKTSLKLGATFRDIEINTDFFKNLDKDLDINEFFNITNPNIDKSLILDKVNALMEIIDSSKNDLNLSNNIEKIAVAVSDNDKKVEDVVKELNISLSDEVKANIQNIDLNIEKVNQKLPPKIIFANEIKIGENAIPIVNSKFITTLKMDTDKNFTDYEIKIPIVNITQKEVNKSNPIETELTINLKDDDNNNIFYFDISNIKIYKENGQNIVEIPKDSKITLKTPNHSVDAKMKETFINYNGISLQWSKLNGILDEALNDELNEINNLTKEEYKEEYLFTISLKNSNSNWICNLHKEENTYFINGIINLINPSAEEEYEEEEYEENEGNEIITPPQPGINENNQSASNTDQGTAGEEENNNNNETSENSQSNTDQGTAGEEAP